MTAAAYESDEAFQRHMDDYQVLLSVRPGAALSEQDVEALHRLDAHWREDVERATDAYHRGWQDGLRHAGGAEFADLQNAMDAKDTELTLAKVMGQFDEQRAFVRGLREMREMLARFVEQGGDATTAMSLRANWNPSWGDDPGPPLGDTRTSTDPGGASHPQASGTPADRAAAGSEAKRSTGIHSTSINGQNDEGRDRG